MKNALAFYAVLLVFGVDGSVVPNHVMHGHICLLTPGPQLVCVFFLHEQHLFSQFATDGVVCQIYFALVFCDLQVMLPTFLSCINVHRGELSFVICDNLVYFFAVQSVERCYCISDLSAMLCSLSVKFVLF